MPGVGSEIVTRPSEIVVSEASESFTEVSDSSRRRFTWSAVVGVVVASVPFLWILTNEWSGTFTLSRRIPFVSGFYDTQAQSIIHGHLWVPTGSLGIEGFVHDGRTYTYFGLLLSLFRMPIILVDPHLVGRLTVPSMLVAWLLTGLVSSLLIWRVRFLLRGAAVLGPAEDRCTPQQESHPPDEQRGDQAGQQPGHQHRRDCEAAHQVRIDEDDRHPKQGEQEPEICVRPPIVDEPFDTQASRRNPQMPVDHRLSLLVVVTGLRVGLQQVESVGPPIRQDQDERHAGDRHSHNGGPDEASATAVGGLRYDVRHLRNFCHFGTRIDLKLCPQHTWSIDPMRHTSYGAPRLVDDLRRALLSAAEGKP